MTNQDQPTIAQAIQVIKRRWPKLVSLSEEAPVFVLAAGWRTGSTFLQRLLMPTCLVWGEPYGRGWPIDAMSAMLRPFTMRWPEPHFFYRGEQLETVMEQFSANLFPTPDYLLKAHLQFHDALFAEPARKAGAPRWGVKEVRLGVDHAHYLRWLFPHAKFLFLYRNPYNAYRSYAARRNAGWRWYYRWPNEPLTAGTFGRHWRELVEGFLHDAAAVDGLVVRYEDLAEGQFAGVEQYLGFSLSRKAAGIRPSDGPSPLKVIPPEELQVFQQQVSVLAKSLGYHYDTPEG